MQKHTTFLDKQQSIEIISQVIENTNDLHNKLGEICYMYDNEGIKLSETDTYQFFINHLIPKNATEKTLFNLILRAMYQLEVKSGGSAYFVFKYTLTLLRNLLKHEEIYNSQETVLVEQLNKFWFESLKPLMESSSKVSNERIIKNTVYNSCSSNKDLACAIYEALMLSGLEGKIFVENGKQKNYIVELKNGYTFQKSVEPFKFLLENDTSWSRSQVKMMIIDGMVEEVSEIDKLLNKAGEEKQPLLIVATGFSEEVAATCKMNNDTGRFDVQLLRLSPDVWSLNVVNDLSVIAGTTPISSLQGHVISLIKWEELPTVDRVQITLQQTNIENSSTQQSVLMHTKNIIEKKKEANTLVEDIQNIYDSRLKTLASNAVYLFLPQMTEIENKSIRITVDNVLRNIKSIIQFGTIDLNKFDSNLKLTKTENKLETVVKNTLLEICQDKQIKEMPLMTVALGSIIVSKMCIMIVGSSGFIITTS